MKYWIAAMLIICAGPALAQHNGVRPECRMLADHRPALGTEYEPGIDARGRPVAPADLNAAPMGADRQSYVVPLTVQLANRLDLLREKGVYPDVLLGFLEISPEGRVSFDGQDLTSELRAACDEWQRDVDALSGPQPDGQSPGDGLMSGHNQPDID